MIATVLQHRVAPFNRYTAIYFRSQALLGLFLAVNVAVVWIGFQIESAFLPWRSRLDTLTPGWCFALGQAAAVGLATALSCRRPTTLILHAFLAATLVAYAYALAGVRQCEPTSAIEYSRLLFRAVDLGVLALSGFAVGVTVRVLLCERIVPISEASESGRRQFGVRGLILLMSLYGLSFGLVNVFFDTSDRSTQLIGVSSMIIRALPASLPWLWGAMQRPLSIHALVFVVASSVVLWYAKAIMGYVITYEPWAEIIQQTGGRAAAYAAAGALNGVLLRYLGFYWRRPI